MDEIKISKFESTKCASNRSKRTFVELFVTKGLRGKLVARRSSSFTTLNLGENILILFRGG
jgi:hypothetical protein